MYENKNILYVKHIFSVTTPIKRFISVFHYVNEFRGFLSCFREFNVCCIGVIPCTCSSAAIFVNATKHTPMMFYITLHNKCLHVEPTLCSARQKCVSITSCNRAVTPWLTRPNSHYSGNKNPNLALVLPHKQGMKTCILLLMECWKQGTTRWHFNCICPLLKKNVGCLAQCFEPHFFILLGALPCNCWKLVATKLSVTPATALQHDFHLPHVFSSKNNRMFQFM